MSSPGRPSGTGSGYGRLARSRRTGLLLLVLAAGLALPRSARAQWQIGFQGGPTVSTLSGSFVDAADPVLGGTVGIDLERWLGPGWVIDVDVALVQRGAGDLPAGSRLVDFRLSYLEAPITVGRTFPLFGGGWRIGPYAGAALSWLSSCGMRFQGQHDYMDCVEERPGGEPSRLDPSVPVGVALRHRYPGGSRISVDVRYSYSLSSALTPGDLSARSHLLQVVFGFTLPLSGPEP